MFAAQGSAALIFGERSLSLAAKVTFLEHTPFPIRFDHVSFDYGHGPVLADISCSIAEHTVVAVLGKSGSGKSTLLELINGIVKPTGGTVHLFDRPLDYQQIVMLRRKIGYGVQNTGLFPHLTVGENIGMPGVISGMDVATISARVAELLELVQLDRSYVTKYPHELSGGEQQRISLCRAMFSNPPVLLMDEPFSSLDYSTKRHIYTHFQTLQKASPRTVVLVTHDWDEAMLLADSFLWIDQGHIRASGDRAALHAVKDAYLQQL